MKIKCPSCSKTLNIPDAAYGKQVKCPCGKQLKVPAGKSPAGSRTTQTTPKPLAPIHPPAAQKAASQVDSSFFDELTDTDLQPVRAVNRPGQVVPVASGANAALAKAGGEIEQEVSSKRKARSGNARKQVLSSIGILLFLGLVRVGFGIFLYLGAEAEVADFEGEFDGEVSTLLMFVRIVYGAQIAMGATFLGCAAFISTFPMSASITAMVTFILGEVMALILNPFRLFSIGGWLFRAAIFGALAQAINNASYFKYVKAGN
jgi:hypothetical protein